tara:strand:+ start:119 stop:937 length:819 start_codon:yes stop_codon:yes gene_type:complete
MVTKFYSQHFQDVFIFRNFINQKCNGIFVEIGGNDGIAYSNTKFFEDYLGFTGMLIEPHPEQFRKMEKNRENCICYNYAVDLKEGYSNFFIPNGCTMMGGIKDLNPAKRRKDRDDEIKVKTIPFNKILNTSVYKNIDIIFIDVEGAEENVLKTMDWDIKIYMICIELDGINKEKDERCRNIMRKNGFSNAAPQMSYINEFWVNKSNKRDNIYKEKKTSFFEKPTLWKHGHHGDGGCVNKDGLHVQVHEEFISFMAEKMYNYEKEKGKLLLNK